MDVNTRQKWTALFKFHNASGSGLLTISEVMEYPCHLLREGRLDEAWKMAKLLEKLWNGVLEASGRSKGETSIGLEDWIKGHCALSQQDWYHNEAVPAMSGAMFDIMDKDHDNVISLTEWRDHYRRYGVKSEEFIQSTFAKMDTNNDGLISGQEFDYAIRTYIKDDPENEYSFLYTIK